MLDGRKEVFLFWKEVRKGKVVGEGLDKMQTPGQARDDPPD